MQASPLSQASTWDLVASDYANEIAPVFELFAHEALRLSGASPGARILDVAAGPGTLALLAADQGLTVAALDFSPRMVDALRVRAEAKSLRNIDFVVGDGMELPYGDAQFDAGFSLFGLMFFPDRSAGFRELARVLKPGAKAVVSSWLPITDNRLLMTLASELQALTLPPGAERPPALPPALGSEEECLAEMREGGFTDVTVKRVTAVAPYPTTAELVLSFARSGAPVALEKQRLGADWPAVEAELIARLCAKLGPGPQNMEMPAFLTVGRRPLGPRA